MKEITATLVYPMRANGHGDEVLLARKTRKIGIGKWNGWGGKVERGETVREAAIRELKGESNLEAKPEDLEFVGTLHFKNPDLLVHVETFLLRKWRGKLQAKKDEMKDPTWFPVSNLPVPEEFMAGDPYFLPQLLKGEKIMAWVEYGPNQATLLKPVYIQPFRGEMPL
jgi:ADP-ribose pyrophosphatase YjhB (NUDIX family)